MARVRTVQQVILEEGLDHKRIAQQAAKGDLLRLRRGAYADPGDLADAESHVRLCEAVSLQRADAVMAGMSAAAAWGLPVLTSELNTVHVYSGHCHGHVRAGIRQHLGTPQADVVLGTRLAVTSISRTVIDVARWHGLEWGVILADAALHRGLFHPEQLEGAVARAGSIWGLQLARRSVKLADHRAESPLESLSRVQMVRMGIPMPTLQHTVELGGGRSIRFDFAWEDVRAAGECDGAVKYDECLTPDQKPSDVVMAEKGREELARELNWWLFRWDWKVAWNYPAFERRILSGLRNARTRHGRAA